MWIRHSGNVWYRTAASKQLTEKSNFISAESHAQRCHLCFGMGFPGSSAGKESACNAGDPGLIPGIGSCPGEGIGYTLQYSWISLVAQKVKNPPALRETWVWSLGWKIPWRGGMTTHSSFLAWRIPMDRGAWQATDCGVTKSQTWLSNLAHIHTGWKYQTQGLGVFYFSASYEIIWFCRRKKQFFSCNSKYFLIVTHRMWAGGFTLWFGSWLEMSGSPTSGKNFK